MIPYSSEENALILILIKHRRIQLQCDREGLSKSKNLSEWRKTKIIQELEDLRKLELTNRGHRIS